MLLSARECISYVTGVYKIVVRKIDYVFDVCEHRLRNWYYRCE